jgi:hypothetical protein
MNSIMNEILAFGARVQHSGIDSKWLWIIALLFAFSLFLSLREVMQWYLGVGRLRREVREMRETLEYLTTRMSEPTEPEPKEFMLEKALAAKPQSFPVHH